MKRSIWMAAPSAAIMLAACSQHAEPKIYSEAAAAPPPAPVTAPMEGARYAMEPGSPAVQSNTERYESVDPNPVKQVATEPVSTFSIDVDTASYANTRRYLTAGQLPPKDAVRVEELINYFDYDWPEPKSGEPPFMTHLNLAPSPFNQGRELLHVTVQGRGMDDGSKPPVNLTLLIDVSGSMEDENKLPLAKKALKELVGEMGPRDTIAIVVYASDVGVVLEPTRMDEADRIVRAISQLEPGGSTAGAAGIELAYAQAEAAFQPGAVNRVMLVTDGDFNVGISDPDQLEDYIEDKRKSGIYLSILGMGAGNYNDQLMQAIAQTGNGTAYYVDTLREAKKVLSEDLAGNLYPLADDVKIQIEFNPARVAEYRLIGYETRLLNQEDFNNDKVDAGDIGAGSRVTAIYELTPTGSAARAIDPSRYAPAEPAATQTSGEWAFVKVRYKPPGSAASQLLTKPVTDAVRQPSLTASPEAVRFSTAVAGYGQLLRRDVNAGIDWTWKEVITLADNAKGEDRYGYRAEFVGLARQAQQLDTATQ